MGGNALTHNEDIEELTCINLARMWDTEDATVPWDWRRSVQFELEKKKKGEGETKQHTERKKKRGGG